jgi:hypothetical protein
LQERNTRREKGHTSKFGWWRGNKSRDGHASIAAEQEYEEDAEEEWRQLQGKKAKEPETERRRNVFRCSVDGFDIENDDIARRHLRHRIQGTEIRRDRQRLQTESTDVFRESPGEVVLDVVVLSRELETQRE